MALREEVCTVEISKKSFSILQTMMREMKLTCEDLINELFILYKKFYSTAALSHLEKNTICPHSTQEKAPLIDSKEELLKEKQSVPNTSVQTPHPPNVKDSDMSDGTLAQINISGIDQDSSPDKNSVDIKENTVSTDTGKQKNVVSSGEPEDSKFGSLFAGMMCQGTEGAVELEMETWEAVKNIGDVPLKVSKSDAIKKKETMDAEGRPFHCETCSASFKLRHHLRVHMNVHNAGHKHMCETCNKLFKSADSLKRHARSHHSDGSPQVKKYKCDICDYRSDYPSDLIKHKRRHTQDKCFKCDICSFATSWKKNLHDHMTTHGGWKKFKCEQCDYVTHNKITLTSHRKARHGPKYVCEVCGHDYASLSSLREHLNKHTDVKTYFCKFCDYGTSYRSNLKKHALIHAPTKLYVCETCEKKFTQNSHLKAHKKTIHSVPGKEYYCSACDYVTLQSQSLNSHMKKHKNKKSKNSIENNHNQAPEIENDSKKSQNDIALSKNDTCTSVSLDNLVAAAESLADCSAGTKETSMEHNYALVNLPVDMPSNRDVAFHNQAPIPVSEVNLLGPNVPNFSNPTTCTQQQQPIYLAQDSRNVGTDLQPISLDNLSLPVLNVQDFHQSQTGGDGYSTYTIHHVVTPQ